MRFIDSSSKFTELRDAQQLRKEEASSILRKLDRLNRLEIFQMQVDLERCVLSITSGDTAADLMTSDPIVGEAIREAIKSVLVQSIALYTAELEALNK